MSTILRPSHFAFAIGMLSASMPASPQTWAQSIHVGPNVQVSVENPKSLHTETILAADKRKPRLLACSITRRDSTAANLPNNLCYVSFDGGKSWKQSRIDGGPTGKIDPAVAYGGGDTAYFIGEGPGLFLFRSDDGGKTFHSVKAQGLRKEGDRSWLIADSKDPDKLHVAHDLGLFTTIDGGDTFQQLESKAIDSFAQFSDGSLAAISSDFEDKDGQDILNFRYREYQHGKQIIETPVLIAKNIQSYNSPDIANIPGLPEFRFGRAEGAFPRLAVDATNGPFKDRLYLVWPSLRGAFGRTDILLSRSEDRGRTWSTPIRLNDDRLPPLADDGVHQSRPEIAVNNKGVVAVTWYDKAADRHNLMNYHRRAVLSSDGGNSFSPSFPLSNDVNREDVANDLFQVNTSPNGPFIARIKGIGVAKSLGVGHTTGLVADGDGVFHASWVDSRTGFQQLWTAPFSIDGRAERNGGGALAALDDVSSSLDEVLTSYAFDRQSSTLSIEVAFKNIGKTPLKGPFTVRVLDMPIAETEAEIINSDNGEISRGAQWKFASEVLAPGATTQKRLLKFRVKQSKEDFPVSQVSFEWRMFSWLVNWQILGKARAN